jgi:hypothetical protein
MKYNTRKLNKKDEGLHLLVCEEEAGQYFELVVLKNGLVFDYPQQVFSEPLLEFYKDGVFTITKWLKL